MTFKTLSFCVTSYDRDYHLLDRLWHSLLAQSVPPEEIIVVSSGMPMKNVKENRRCIIAGRGIPVHHVHSSKRLSVSDARNLGASLSSQEVTQFFDCDDYLHRDFINVTKQSFASDSDLEVLVHSYIRSLTGVPPEMQTPHQFSEKRLKTISWSTTDDHIVMSASEYNTWADGPTAIITTILDSVKYKRYCPGFQDKEMLRYLIANENRVVKGYDFPTMTYFPANETGRPKTGASGPVDLSRPFPYTA